MVPQSNRSDKTVLQVFVASPNNSQNTGELLLFCFDWRIINRNHICYIILVYNRHMHRSTLLSSRPQTLCNNFILENIYAT